VLHLIEYYLGDILKETGQLCYAGGVALNVKLNQRIIARDDVKELFVQLFKMWNILHYTCKSCPAVVKWFTGLCVFLFSEVT